MEIELKVKCDKCDEYVIEDGINCFCDKCVKENEYENIRDLGISLIKEIFSHRDLTGKYVVGFSSIEEKETYLNAYNHGLETAAFWVADSCGCTLEWEKSFNTYIKTSLNIFWPDKENEK